jgi:hypothetical protein
MAGVAFMAHHMTDMAQDGKLLLFTHLPRCHRFPWLSILANESGLKCLCNPGGLVS